MLAPRMGEEAALVRVRAALPVPWGWQRWQKGARNP